ncbi:tetratricopeptide repeat protein [Virgibacillus doumboii]|uniref:tetratricopeptide repeat protein n=1 Tax=Virgibacillus doumboii TaxID=2697503 RepID=UPI0013E0C7EC|nr:tetratricopeptide repeat protein [Virgibacillus doumboii]
MILGERLRFFRKSQQTTQEEVAEGICSVSYYSKIENGQTTPSNEIIQLLCNRLGIKDSYHDQIFLQRLKGNALNFYRLIRNQEIKKGKQVYRQIVDEFCDSLDPDISLITGLVQLRMALFDSDNKQAAHYYDKVVKLNEYLDRELSFLYCRVCGLYHYLYGDLGESLKLYKNVEQIGNYEFIEEVYYQMALIYSRQNKLSFSSFYLEKALEIFVIKMDYKQCTNCNIILGVNYRKMQESEKAIECYNNILVQNPDNKELVARTHHNLGLVYSKLKQSEIAIQHLLKSLSIKESLKGVSPANTMYLIGKEFFIMDKITKALEWLEKGLKSIQEFENKDVFIKLRVLEQLINDQIVESYMNDVAIPFFKSKGELETVSEFTYLLAGHHERNEEYKKAYFLLKNHKEGGVTL